MDLSTSELQWIVDRVKERLSVAAAHAPSPDNNTSSLPTNKANPTSPNKRSRHKDIQPIAHDQATTHLDVRILSCDLISRQLVPHQSITLSPKTIITPAAIDMLAERKIRWSRKHLSVDKGSNDSNQTATKIAVVGRAPWLETVQRRACPQLVTVISNPHDDTSALSTSMNAIASPDRIGILIVDSPYATCWQAGRHERVRPVVIRDCFEADIIVREVPANLLIAGVQNWNAPSVLNLIRRLTKAVNHRSS